MGTTSLIQLFSSYFIIAEHRVRLRLGSALFIGTECLPLFTPGQHREPVVLRHSGVTMKCKVCDLRDLDNTKGS